MKYRNILILPLIIAVGIVLLPGSATSQQKTLKEQIVGTWRVVDTVIARPDGTKARPFGDNPRGFMTFTGDGNFILLNTRSDIPKFASNNRYDATSEESRVGLRGIYGFFGTYEVNDVDKTLKFTVIGSTFPNEVGSSNTRVVKSISPDELVYTNAADTTGGGALEATLRRVK
jgi:hypothetical protein